MTKITELTEITSGEVANTNILPIVAGIGGTPITRKIPFSTLLAAIRYEEIYVKVISDDVEVSAGTGKFYFTVPDRLDGVSITDINLSCAVLGTSGATEVDLYNVTDAQYVTPSDKPSLAYSYYSTYSSGDTVAIVNGTLSAGDRIRIDINSVSAGVKGLDVIITVDLL